MADDRPNAGELLEAVQEFLQERAVGMLGGHAAFEARIAANLLAIARREIALGPRLAADDAAGLAALIGEEGAPEQLEAALVALIREGDLGPKWRALIAYLRRSAEERLRIANPRYLEES
ncbi:MAG: DUF6285 domain-containing protein [Myxococcota bacterium]